MVEIVKREHLERLRARRSPSLAGVHQYNEVGAFQDLSSPVSSPDVTEMLSGSKFGAFLGPSRVFVNNLRSVTIKKTVFMKVTLSRKKLQYLVDRGATWVATRSIVVCYHTDQTLQVPATTSPHAIKIGKGEGEN